MSKSLGRSKTSGAARKRKSITSNNKSRRKHNPKTAEKIVLRFFSFVIELISLCIILAIIIIAFLGHSVIWFSGTHWFFHQLPFVLSMTISVLLLTVLLTGWWKFRNKLKRVNALLPTVILIAVSSTGIWLASQANNFHVYQQFKILVGGKRTVRTQTISHQIYASYRRENLVVMEALIRRSMPFHRMIEEAADSYDLDPDLLKGVAAVESSFKPRPSKDGGKGLFQITRVPKAAMANAERRLTEKISIANPRHNAFIASATLQYYLNQMNDDLLLGLLAYNIGPANGGLKYIMERYGATDFVTIQPYLQIHPSQYPIKVLSSALAFRIWHSHHRLIPYAKGQNAVRIQQLGIPGLLIP